MAQDKVRIAMLGTGFIAEFRAQVYARLEGAQVVSVLGRDRDKTEGFAARNRIGFAAIDLEKLLAGPTFDAVDLCLPNNLHAEVAIRCAQAGRHIICEKPLGRTAAEAETMLAAAERAGIIHAYGENMIYSPDFREIISVIENGTIGRPLWMRGREAHFGPHSPWFWKKELSGGGALIDMGCHLIAMFNLILKEMPTEVFAHAPTLHHDTDCEDNVLAMLKYSRGVIGQCEASWTQRGGMAVAFEACGDEGTIVYDRSGLSQPVKVFARNATKRYFSEKVEHDRGWLFPTVDEYWRYGYYDQLRHFVDCVRNKTTPYLTFLEGVAVNRIMDAAYASARSGRWEQVATAPGAPQG
jgi:predicted dehydrogenase